MALNPKLITDGIFGPKTRQVGEVFQLRNHCGRDRGSCYLECPPQATFFQTRQKEIQSGAALNTEQVSNGDVAEAEPPVFGGLYLQLIPILGRIIKRRSRDCPAPISGMA